LQLLRSSDSLRRTAAIKFRYSQPHRAALFRPLRPKPQRRIPDPLWGLGSYFAHASPGTCRRTLVSVQVRLTTVTPWSSRSWLDAGCGDQKRGRSVSLPRLAYPLESPAEAQARFSEDPAI